MQLCIVCFACTIYSSRSLLFDGLDKFRAAYFFSSGCMWMANFSASSAIFGGCKGDGCTRGKRFLMYRHIKIDQLPYVFVHAFPNIFPIESIFEVLK